MIRWNGLPRYKVRLRNAPRKLKQKAQADIAVWGRNVANLAQQNAPVDLGKLRQSIAYVAILNGYGAEVSVNVPYAAFVEFGVGASVVIPRGWEEIAARFKGKGERKITLSPQPFLIPAVLVETPKLKRKLRRNLGDI